MQQVGRTYLALDGGGLQVAIVAGELMEVRYGEEH